MMSPKQLYQDMYKELVDIGEIAAAEKKDCLLYR